MEDKTNEALSSILGDEFKTEILKRDNIIRSFKNEEDNIKKNIESLRLELDDLISKKSKLNEEIILAYSNKEEEFKKEKENFENSKNNTVSALDAREKDLESKLSLHESNVKAHLDNSHKLSQEKSQFNSKVNSIAETLEQAGNAHSDLFRDAVKSLREIEPVPVVPVTEPLTLIEQE